MGNVVALCPRRPAVEERLTRPRRLLRQLSDVDSGLLRRLIRSGDLAPCFDAAEDNALAGGGAEECPICFYFYPGLNRSKCCGKGICTECFLQLLPSKASKSVLCPFCKTASYAVKYHGARTTIEKKPEQEEEQNLSEAKMRPENTFKASLGLRLNLLYIRSCKPKLTDITTIFHDCHDHS